MKRMIVVGFCLARALADVAEVEGTGKMRDGADDGRRAWRNVLDDAGDLSGTETTVKRGDGRMAGMLSSCGRVTLERTWMGSLHAPAYATPLAEDVERDGRGGVVTQSASGRVRALDGVSGVELEGAVWGQRHGRASRAGIVRIGSALASASLDGEIRMFDARRERCRARLKPLTMKRAIWNGSGDDDMEGSHDPVEIERRHEAKHRAPGSTRSLLSIEDEEARSDRAWNAVDAQWRAKTRGENMKDELRRAMGDEVSVDAHVLCAPAVGDVDGDGALELVFAVSYYFDDSVHFDDEDEIEPEKYAATGIVVLDSEDLSVKLAVTLDESGRAYGSPTLADVDGNGRLDIALGTYGGGVHVVDGISGTALPGWPKHMGRIEAQIAIADVDADGENELIACDVRGEIAAFKSDGNKLWRRSVESRISVGAAVGDIDGDGALDVVVGTTSGAVHAYRAADGSALGGWPVSASDKILAPIVLTKIRPNKLGLDVIVAAHDGVVNIFDGKATCRDVVDVAEKIYAAPVVTSFAGSGALDVVVSTMQGNVHAFRAKGSKFDALAVSPSDSHAARVGYFGVVLRDRAHRVVRGTRINVAYEIVDRRVLNVAKSKRTREPYQVTITLIALDGFERSVTAKHAHAGKFTLWVDVPATKTRGEIRARVVDATLNDAEDAYSLSFHDNYESILKWLVAVPFLLASFVAIRRASEEALELDVFGASATIPTTSKGKHEE